MPGEARRLPGTRVPEAELGQVPEEGVLGLAVPLATGRLPSLWLSRGASCSDSACPPPLQMPRLWLDYCQFLMDQGRVTHTRRTFDRALRALPITQHSRIWPLYLRFLRSHPLPETAVRGYRRFLKVSLWGRGGATGPCHEVPQTGLLGH